MAGYLNETRLRGLHPVCEVGPGGCLPAVSTASSAPAPATGAAGCPAGHPAPGPSGGCRRSRHDRRRESGTASLLLLDRERRCVGDLAGAGASLPRCRSSCKWCVRRRRASMVRRRGVDSRLRGSDGPRNSSSSCPRRRHPSAKGLVMPDPIGHPWSGGGAWTPACAGVTVQGTPRRHARGGGIHRRKGSSCPTRSGIHGPEEGRGLPPARE